MEDIKEDQKITFDEFLVLMKKIENQLSIITKQEV